MLVFDLVKMAMQSSAPDRTSLPAPTDYDASRPIGDATARRTAPTHLTNHPIVVSFPLYSKIFFRSHPISFKVYSIKRPTRLSVLKEGNVHRFPA